MAEGLSRLCPDGRVWRRSDRIRWIRLSLICAGLVVAGADALADTYYVDVELGTDGATGLSPKQAWRTLDRVDAARLKPGDAVLFRRDRVWHGQLEVDASGRAGAPITFGAYGTGAPPVLEGASHGIIGKGQRHIVVRDLHIRNTRQSGIWAKRSDHWRLENVRIEETGDGKDGGGITWWEGKELAVSGCTLERVTGDGIWAWRVVGLKLLHNDVRVVQGASADNVHIQHARDFEIRGNRFSMDGPTNSGKGNVLLTGSRDGVIAANTFIAGNYAIGLDSGDTLIEGNHFVGHDRASWSAAINMGSGRSPNLTIRNNFFDGARVGISLFELKGEWGDAPVVRTNMTISNNIFNVRQHALVIDWPVQYSGGFTGNTIIGTPGRDWTRVVAPAMRGGWHETGTEFVTTLPEWHGGAPCRQAPETVSAC